MSFFIVFLHALVFSVDSHEAALYSRFPGQEISDFLRQKKINFLGGSLDTCFFTYQLLIDCYPVTYLFLFVFFLLILFQVTYLLKCHA